ncbi:MAG: urea carboxylase-associated family protein [Paracoccaceae bacterium]
MKKEPDDANKRRGVSPVICYPSNRLKRPNLKLYRSIRGRAKKIDEITINPRDAKCFRVKAGQFFRITSIEGPQVGDLNLWNLDNLSERFYSGKTRALHGSHMDEGDQMWSCFPYLRPMATVFEDTLKWYGVDKFGGSVHDVIGTRCDPYTNKLLEGNNYHHCCHSNLARALAAEIALPVLEAESLIHDVLNVFMCTGFTRDTGQYFMKASPVRPGDYIEFFAEIDLLGALSACPGGDCSTKHSSDSARCYPILVEIFLNEQSVLNITNDVNGYNRKHGLQ